MAQKTKARKKAPEDGFPARLKELRTRKGLTQAQLAEIVDSHEIHVGRYERGEAKPSADKLRKLAQALGVSGDYLLAGDTSDAVTADFEDRELLEMFREVEKFSAKEKNVVKELLDAFITRKKIKEMTAK